MVSPAVSRTLRWLAGIQDDDQAQPPPAVSSYNDPTDTGTLSSPLPAAAQPVAPSDTDAAPSSATPNWMQSAYDTGAGIAQGISSAASQLGQNAADAFQQDLGSAQALGRGIADTAMRSVTAPPGGYADPLAPMTPDEARQAEDERQRRGRAVVAGLTEGGPQAALGTLRQEAPAIVGMTPPTTPDEIAWASAPAPARLGKLAEDAAQAYGGGAGRRIAEGVGYGDEHIVVPDNGSLLGGRTLPFSVPDVAQAVGSMVTDPLTYAAGGPLVEGAQAAAVRGLLTEGRAGLGAARGVVGRLAEALGTEPATVAPAGTGIMELGSGVVPERPPYTAEPAEGTRRFYHGTAAAFDRPDPGRFDQNGLFGPGYYLTSDPRVASSYAADRNFAPGGITPLPRLRAMRLEDEIARTEGELARPGLADEDRAWLEQRLPGLRAELDHVTSQGPNVRAVDVPAFRPGEPGYVPGSAPKLFDLDSPGVGQDAYDVISREMRWLGLGPPVNVGPNSTGLEVYGAIEDRFRDALGDVPAAKAAVNDMLHRIGWDGLAHTGGRLVPLLDENGRPIEHDVAIIFPGSLDKVRNAFSGTPGGSGFVPSLGSGLRSTLANAAQGGVLGAASEDLQAQQEGRDPDPTSRLARAGIGAGLAVLAGNRAATGALARGASELGSGFVGRPSAEAAVNAADPMVAMVGRMMEGDYQTYKAPDPRTAAQRIGDAWAQHWTDNRAGLYRLQNAVSQALGRPLQPAEMVAELSRVNPASVAQQRLSENLRPALQAVGADQDWLAQYLVHSHNVDVAREMGQRTYAAALAAGRTPQEASAAAIRSAGRRTFSGDLTLPETQAALSSMEQTVRSFPNGDRRWQNIGDAAQAVWDHNAETLARKRDAGLITPELHDELTTRYPRYVRTDIADYFDKGAAGPAPAGRMVGTSDIGIQKLDPRGTGKDRVNPLLSTIDQTHSAESAIARNRAGQAFEDLVQLDPTWAQTFKEVVPASGVNVGDPKTTVPASYTLRSGEQFFTTWKDGQPRTFVVPPAFAALVQPQGGRILGDNAAVNTFRSAMSIYKELLTSKNPAFSMLVSPIRDAGDYAIREATRSARPGGAGIVDALTSLPGVMADYVRAVPDAFAGILQGRYRGDLAALMREGAGQITRPGRSDPELRAALADLSSRGGMAVTSLADLKRLAGNVLTLGAGPIGERLEQIPRLAAARREAARGGSPLQQSMAFRDATIDFQRGGDWAKAINSVVPFFNTALQGSAQVARTARANPAAFLASTAATVGGMTAASEAWNAADPQRAADYADVPDYLKRTGVVFMLPGVEGTDQRGDRRPNFVWVPTGNYGALVAAARDAVRGAGTADLSTLGGWGQLASDTAPALAGGFSPIRGDTAGAVLSSLVPPGLSTGLELAANRDLFRGATIATDRADQAASALSSASATGYNRLTGQETRPSQWEYLYRDLGGYGAGLAMAGSNLAAQALGARPAPADERPIQDLPVVGGIAGRIVRDTGGQGYQRAIDERQRVPESIRATLEEVGLRREQVVPVGSTIQNVPLSRAEQQDWQERTNAYIEDAVDRATRSAAYGRPNADRQRVIQDAIAAAKQRAGDEVLRTIPLTERKQRVSDAGRQAS